MTVWGLRLLRDKMTAPNEDYKEHPLSDQIRGLLAVAEVGRRAKRQSSSILPEFITQFLTDFREKHMVAYGKRKEAEFAEQEANKARQELEGKVQTAISAYLKANPYNHRAVEAIDQFQANFSKVYDVLGKGEVDGVIAALEHVESDIKKPEQYESLESYVSTIPASRDIRNLFLPESDIKSREPMVAAALVAGAFGIAALVGSLRCSYLLNKEFNSMYNVPGFTHKMPAPRDWHEPVIEIRHAGPTRDNVRTYLDNHPDLLKELCPACEPCPQLPVLIPVETPKVSATVSQGPEPSATKAEEDDWGNAEHITIPTRPSKLGN